jgi:hypothetical protein
VTVAGNGKPSAARHVGARGTFRLEPPRLRTIGDPREERHATWFELFFGLVFIAAVAQLGGALAVDPSAGVFARFAALFVVVVWAWVLYTLYANRFDTDDVIFRLAKSGAMLAIAAIAVNLHQTLDGRGGTVAFAGRIRRPAVVTHRVVHPCPTPRRRSGPQARRHVHRGLLGHDGTLARLDLRAQPSSLRVVVRGDGDRPRDPHPARGPRSRAIPS